ncbi:MAG: hypothetical protein ACREQE_01350 [Candidatus Binataceae bacterium]
MSHMMVVVMMHHVTMVMIMTVAVAHIGLRGDCFSAIRRRFGVGCRLLDFGRRSLSRLGRLLRCLTGGFSA